MRRRAGFAPSWKSPSIIGAAHKPRRAAMQSRDGFQALAREFTGLSDTRLRSDSRTSGNEKVRRALVDLGFRRFDKSEALVGLPPDLAGMSVLVSAGTDRKRTRLNTSH